MSGFKITQPKTAYVALVSNASSAGSAGSSLIVDDEGTPLATAATTLNFVGAGVTATGTGATKTITIPGGTTSPLTTKGDVYTYSTVNARLAVGTNGQALVADSTQTTGNKWATAAGDVSGPYTALVVSTTAVQNAGRWEVVMTVGITDPPEPVWTADGTDWVYAWVPA